MDEPQKIERKPREIADENAPAKDRDQGASRGGKKSYYYDDATGYEVYDPEADDDESEPPETPEPSRP